MTDDLPPMRSQAAARLANDMIAGSVKSPDWPENVLRLQAKSSTLTVTENAYVAYMAERGEHLNMLVELAHQYMSDLRYPPSPDSKERRIERIVAVLKQVQP